MKRLPSQGFEMCCMSKDTVQMCLYAFLKWGDYELAVNFLIDMTETQVDTADRVVVIREMHEKVMTTIATTMRGLHLAEQLLQCLWKSCNKQHTKSLRPHGALYALLIQGYADRNALVDIDRLLQAYEQVYQNGRLDADQPTLPHTIAFRAWEGAKQDAHTANRLAAIRDGAVNIKACAALKKQKANHQK